METFFITLRQMLVLFTFMLCGYIFKKKNITADSLGNVLSRLELYIFMPALCFNTFSTNFRLSMLSEKLTILAVSTVVLAVTFALALLLSRLFSKDKMTKAIYTYAFTIPNLGYLGYPLVGAVFGEQVLLDFMIFAIPYNLFIFTVGMYILNPKREWSLKNLLNPSLLAIAAGMAAGLLNLGLPQFAGDALDMAADCMAPVAMILTGFVLARRPAKTMFSNRKMYIAALLRLLAIPAAAAAVLYITGAPAELRLLTLSLLVLPMGLNNVVFPEAFGSDSTVGAQSCFISNILGLVTIPLMFGLIAIL